MEDEFLRLIRKNTKKIPKHMRDTESCRESLLFIYKAGAAAMRERCAEMTEKFTLGRYRENEYEFDLMTERIATAIREIEVE